MLKPNSNIFCNTPWYELHIYWDGSFGICCQESHKLYSTDNQQYNISNMTMAEWFRSEPVNQFRKAVLGNQRLSACNRCYLEEDHDGHSRRLKSNQKSGIFTRLAFEPSFRQSPGFYNFEHSANNAGETKTLPVDLHIDLGNYCNLACKMCNSRASSTIASQEVKWGIVDSRKYLGTDWTRNGAVWNNFLQQLLSMPGLNNIHLMGGETLLTDRFEQLVDFMTMHERFDVCFSFVSNGTVFKPELIKKLQRFRRVGIEISIETVDEHNSYLRQGTDTQQVLENISKYLELCNGSTVTVTLRPVPNLLSIGYYIGVLKYALDKKLIVKSNLCSRPRCLSAEILPAEIKQQYKSKYVDFLKKLNDIKTDHDYNASDPNNYQLVIKEQVEMCISLLSTPTSEDSEQELERMVRHCERWDSVYGYDARTLYPEFAEILQKYGYKISG